MSDDLSFRDAGNGLIQVTTGEKTLLLSPRGGLNIEY
jgi:hypothetical protein